MANFDGTNVSYSPECTKTPNKKGARTIMVMRAPSSQRCTVMLGVSGLAYKLPKEVSELKEVHLSPRKALYPTSVHYNCQAKAWIDTELFLDFITKIV